MLLVASASLAAAVTPDLVPTGGVLIHRVGRGVAVGDRADVELVQVVDVDGEDLVRDGAIAGGGADRDIVMAPSASRSMRRRPRSPRPCWRRWQTGRRRYPVSQYVIVLFVASASLAAAVMPTVVPLAAFSFTALAAALLSVTAPDVELIEVVDVDREDLVGERAVGGGGADRDVVAGAVRFPVDRPPATVTTPVLASMANRPPSLSCRL